MSVVGQQPAKIQGNYLSHDSLSGWSEGDTFRFWEKRTPIWRIPDIGDELCLAGSLGRLE